VVLGLIHWHWALASLNGGAKAPLPNLEYKFKVVAPNLIDSFDMSQNDLSKSSFTFVSPQELAIKKKIENNGIILKDWDNTIKSGIKTGLNEAFIIDEDKKNELIKADSKNKEIIKPYLRGRDIKKYSYQFANKWIITTKLHSNEYLENKYPVIFKYLSLYKDKLSKRGQCTNRGDKGQHHWLELDNNPTDNYFNEFEKEKIIWIELSDLGKFTFDSNKYFIDMTIFMITGQNLKYILSLLNSKLIFWYFNLICAESGVGTNRWKKTYVEQIPIPKLPNYKLYEENINYLINLPHQKRYDRKKRFVITTIDNKELYITEFLFAKQRGYIEKYQGHTDLDLSFYKLLIYMNKNLYIIFENSDDKRLIYGINLDNKRTLLIATENNVILSIFLQNNKNLNKQITNGRLNIRNQFGETTNPLTLNRPAGSCPKAFWRQTDFLELLYQDLTKMSISQDDFVIKIDVMLELNRDLQISKQNFIDELKLEKIPKKLQNFEELNFEDFIKEYKKAKKLKFTDKLEERNFKNEWKALFENDSKIALDLKNQIEITDKEIDNMVYKLYGLSDDEIRMVEGN